LIERDYIRAKHELFKNLDESAFERVVRESVRRGQHHTGRAALQLFGRKAMNEHLDAYILSYGITFGTFDGIKLCAGVDMAKHLALDIADHTVRLYTLPGDRRPHEALEGARAYLAGHMSSEDLRALKHATDNATISAGNALFVHAVGMAGRAERYQLNNAMMASEAASWATETSLMTHPKDVQYALDTTASRAEDAEAHAGDPHISRILEQVRQRERLVDFLLGRVEGVDCEEEWVRGEYA